jgi:hypothetical protein
MGYLNLISIPLGASCIAKLFKSKILFKIVQIILDILFNFLYSSIGLVKLSVKTFDRFRHFLGTNSLPLNHFFKSLDDFFIVREKCGFFSFLRPILILLKLSFNDYLSES